jgi:hypothetical protein
MRLLRDPVLWILLAVLLLFLAVHWLARADGYNRQEWLPRWEDADGNCRDTRQEVLARDAFPGSVEWDAAGCRVVRGWWRDPYSGELRRDPGGMDIDHVVPLRWAWEHGGAAWPLERKRQFANELGYPGALVATTPAMNRGKGDKGPSRWLPKDGGAACQYGHAWATMLFLYRLEPPELDRAAIRLLVSRC